MTPRRLSTRQPGFDAALAHVAQDGAHRRLERRILGALEARERRERGDAALLDYARRFDRAQAASVAALEIDPATVAKAKGLVPPAQLDALRTAHERIRAFHERQRQASWDYTEADGTRLGQRITPLERFWKS